ncbi:MAG: RNA pyrophosphohydrolase [Rhodospirillaceae bacterium]|nr:RNA pyrophosphohydrolase [Rhodospirillaceae bacterium]
MTVLLPLSQRPYRLGVGIVLLNAQSQVFVAQRIDTPSPAWQMPQGGIDAGEDPRTAAFREMEEEIGTCAAEILAETEDWLTYDIPAEIADHLWKGRFRGQKQKWFLMRFTGTDADINIATKHPEFTTWRWTDFHSLPDVIVPFKRPLYTAVVDFFSPHIHI